MSIAKAYFCTFLNKHTLNISELGGLKYFHMKQITRRYLTLNPRLKAVRALQELIDGLTSASRENFEEEYTRWKSEWHDVLYRKSLLKSGKTRYTHRRLRSAMHSIDFYLPYLFTYQDADCEGMPNTNNKIEGTFTDLKKNQNNHSGMSDESRRRFVSGFFLAWEEKGSVPKHGCKNVACLHEKRYLCRHEEMGSIEYRVSGGHHGEF